MNAFTAMTAERGPIAVFNLPPDLPRGYINVWLMGRLGARCRADGTPFSTGEPILIRPASSKEKKILRNVLATAPEEDALALAYLVPVSEPMMNAEDDAANGRRYGEVTKEGMLA